MVNERQDFPDPVIHDSVTDMTVGLISILDWSQHYRLTHQLIGILMYGQEIEPPSVLKLLMRNQGQEEIVLKPDPFSATGPAMAFCPLPPLFHDRRRVWPLFFPTEIPNVTAALFAGLLGFLSFCLQLGGLFLGPLMGKASTLTRRNLPGLGLENFLLTN
jgi:hypothetical protein